MQSAPSGRLPNPPPFGGRSKDFCTVSSPHTDIVPYFVLKPKWNRPHTSNAIVFASQQLILLESNTNMKRAPMQGNPQITSSDMQWARKTTTGNHPLWGNNTSRKTTSPFGAPSTGVGGRRKPLSKHCPAARHFLNSLRNHSNASLGLQLPSCRHARCTASAPLNVRKYTLKTCKS